MTWGSSVFLAVSVFLQISHSSLFACSCEPLPPITGIDGVTFIGKVTEVVLQSDDDFGRMIRMRLRVLRSWTGVGDDEMTIGSYDSSCVKPLDLGGEYLVFGNPNSSDARYFGFPTINLCDYTRSLSGAEDEIRELDSLLSAAESTLVGTWESPPTRDALTPVHLIFEPLQGGNPSGTFEVRGEGKVAAVGQWRVSMTNGKTGVTTISVISAEPHALTRPFLEVGGSVAAESVSCSITDGNLKLVDEDQHEILYLRKPNTVVEDGGWGYVKKTVGP